MIGDGPGVSCRERPVAGRELAQGQGRPLEKADQLGPHAGMLYLEFPADRRIGKA